MKWLALLVIVLSSFFVSISCSGGDDGVNIGDPCGSSICEGGVLYFCGQSGTISKYADCDLVCENIYPSGEWEFTGECSDKTKSGEYMECCTCENISRDEIVCANVQPNGL